MPTVPSYGDSAYVGPRVATAPLQVSREQPKDYSTAFGAAEGRALQNVGKQVAQVGDRLGQITTELQIQENEFQVKKAAVALSEGYRIALTGDGTPENPGYSSLKGEEAMKALPVLNARLAEIRKNATENIQGTRAKEMFSEYSAPKEQEAFGVAAAHSLQQGEVAKQAIDAARVDSAVSSAATSYADPIALATHVSVAESAARSAIARKSQDPEVLDRAAVVARTEAYKAAIVGAMKDGKLSEAQRLFDLHHTKMDGVVANEVAGVLNAGTDREKIQNAVDGIMAMGLGEEQAMQAVRENFSGQQEDEMITRIATRYAAQRRAESEQDKALASWVFGGINAPGEEAVPLVELARQNPEAYRRLTQKPEMYKAAVAADNARELGESYARVTDSAVYSELRSMSTDELAAVDLVPYKTMLKEKDYKEMENKKDAAIKSLTATGGDKALYTSARGALARFAPKDKEGKAVLTDAQMNAAEIDMNTWVETQRKQGVKITEPDIARKAQSLMLPTIQTSVGFFGGESSKVVGAVGAPGAGKPTDKLRLRADGVVMTAAEIQAANGALIRAGRTPDPETIEQLVMASRKQAVK